MLNSSRRARRSLSRGGRLALVVPTALLTITAMMSPSFADDVTPDDGGDAPAVAETPTPEPAPAPAPAPDPAPAADPAPAPAPAAGPKSAPTPGAAFADAQAADAAAEDDADKGAPVQAAAEEKKVVVCKYVGTPPGVPHHIIVVSVNALPNGFTGSFPWTFSDAQDSVAIRYANGNEQPGNDELANCPLAPVAAPVIPVDDPCGPDNAVYGEVPTGHYTILRNLDGSITLAADAGYAFPGKAPEVFFSAPVDSGVACEQAEIDAPVVPVDDPCGPDNAVYGDVPTGDYEPVVNDDGSITLTAHLGSTFPGGALTYDYPAPTDSGELCVVDEEKKVVVCKYVTTPGGELDHIIIVSVATLIQDGWDGETFPFQFPDAQDSVAIRFAEKGEQAHLIDVAECPSDEPAEIDLPVVPVEDPCGPDNATYGEVPLGDYDIAYNDDGSITLTPLGDATFPGGEVEHTFLPPVDENTEPCVVDDARVVLCTYPSTARVLAPLGTIVIVDLADLLAHGFAGLFPFEYTDGDTSNTAIRYAEDGEVASDIDAFVCGVDDEVVINDPPGDVDAEVVDALPNTGGPAGWLVPLGAGLVMAGAALVLARRPRTA